MKFHPILFSTEMVKAILSGNKTQTRRVVKDKFLVCDEPIFSVRNANATGRCPYGKPGDVLFVRENWQLAGWDFEDGMMTIRYTDDEKLNHVTHDPTEDSMWLLNQVEQLEKKGYLKKDPNDDARFVFTDKKQPFKPSIHMPKEACRLFLQIKNIRVERLQDITEKDATAEGVETLKFYEGYEVSSRGKFEGLWNLINGIDGWELNPWVWVIEFERIEKPKNFC